MFKSKRRNIVTPQSEHLKLVGTLALLWGNEDFDFPPFERNSVVMGMGLHDRGYGYLDNSPIGGMSDEEWYVIARRGFDMPCSDMVADTIVKYHIRRLAEYGDAPERKALAQEFSQAIERQLKAHGLSQTVFDRMDRMTDLCDRVSYTLCFDVPESGEIRIFPRNDDDGQIPVQYHVQDGVIRLEPWPLSVNRCEGYLLAYQADGYPERLDPFILPFRLEQA